MTALFLQKPKFIPTLITVAAVLVCAACGIWQLQRMVWKHDLVDKIEQRVELPATPLPSAIEVPDDWEYRHVTVTGEFLHDKESYLQAQSGNGNFGWQVITPLRRDDGTVVLVNRGWVPYEQRAPEARPDGLVSGTVTVTGLVRLPWQQKWLARHFIPPADLEKKLFFEGDLAHMARAHGLKTLPVFVEADETLNPGGWPKGGQTVLKLQDPHLSYALQWFAFAITALVIFVLYHRRKD
ncbi:SURF1 family protein [Iodidimonas sp. SYSU 1G8]|uniref:SURF1 family protein n=1 Tax=Iodidimonas sp. SYSU 1G8 TaxID=3133967 RepID=UPI0031FEC2D9